LGCDAGEAGAAHASGTARRKAFARLRGAASDQIQLPYPGPSEEAFFAAGREIVEHCDLLFAVWDGAPARGLGGTADIVAFAMDRGRKTIQLHRASHSVRLLGTAPA